MIEPDTRGSTTFLLSPARTDGVRGLQLIARLSRDGAHRGGGAMTLGDAFTAISQLYFRGKLAYARTFGKAIAGSTGVHIITADRGLRSPTTFVTAADLRRMATVDVAAQSAGFVAPLTADTDDLCAALDRFDRVVLLGSVATDKYATPLLAVLGDRLLVPIAFAGRGDMSRGGLLLRCVDEGRELRYAPLLTTARHGPRPPRLPPRAKPPA